jgi:cytochrome c
MKDDLRWNKIFGAILGTLLTIFVLRQGAEMVFATNPPAKPGDAIAVQIASTDSASAAPDTPPDWGTVLPTADVAAGQAQSQKCASCHTFTNGGPNGTGPNNWGVIGRQPGTKAGFNYSAAMVAFGQKVPKWDYDHVYMFLAGPQAYIDGTKMSFVGIKAPQDRINLIAWLRQQSSSPAPIPAPNPKAAAAPAAAAGAATPSTPAPANNTVAAPAGSSSAPAAVAAAPAGGASGASTTTNSQTGAKTPAATSSTASGENAPK